MCSCVLSQDLCNRLWPQTLGKESTRLIDGRRLSTGIDNFDTSRAKILDLGRLQSYCHYASREFIKKVLRSGAISEVLSVSLGDIIDYVRKCQGVTGQLVFVSTHCHFRECHQVY